MKNKYLRFSKELQKAFYKHAKEERRFDKFVERKRQSFKDNQKKWSIKMVNIILESIVENGIHLDRRMDVDSFLNDNYKSFLMKPELHEKLFNVTAGFLRLFSLLIRSLCMKGQKVRLDNEGFSSEQLILDKKYGLRLPRSRHSLAHVIYKQIRKPLKRFNEEAWKNGVLEIEPESSFDKKFKIDFSPLLNFNIFEKKKVECLFKMIEILIRTINDGKELYRSRFVPEANSKFCMIEKNVSILSKTFLSNALFAKPYIDSYPIGEYFQETNKLFLELIRLFENSKDLAEYQKECISKYLCFTDEIIEVVKEVDELTLPFKTLLELKKDPSLELYSN